MAINQKKSVTIERALTQRDFDAFAALSGDDNPIHVDPEFSARTSFGRTVSHGMLLYTVLRGLTEKLVPGSRQLSQELMFPAPTYADELIRFEARIESETSDGVEISVRATRLADETCVCEGRCSLVAGARAP